MATVLTPAAARVLVGLACLLAAGLLAAEPAAGQTGFRVTHAAPRQDDTHFLISGTIVNESGRDALDVSITVEALGSGRRVVASGIAYVAAAIPVGRSASFNAKVPRVAGVTDFRVTVTSVRFGFGSESP